MATAQEVILIEHLDTHLYLEVKPIIAWVEEEFGVRFSVSGMRDLLHRLGFVYKQGKAVSHRADEQAQLDFLDEVLQELLEQADNGQAVLYYSDGCHPKYNTKTGLDWTCKCRGGRVRWIVIAVTSG